MLNRIISFFDLYAQDRPAQAFAQAAGKKQLAWWRQLLVYVGCVLGIVLGPYALDAAAGTYAPFAVMFGSPIRLFWAVVFGFVITAVLFKTVLSAKSPMVLQIGTAIAAGFASGKVVPAAIDALLPALSHAGA